MAQATQRRGLYARTASQSSQTAVSNVELEECEEKSQLQSLSESLPAVTSNDQSSSYGQKHHVHQHTYSDSLQASNGGQIGNNVSNILSPELQEVRVFSRGYMRWEGSNHLFCGGRIIGGPEVSKLIVTLIMILIPSLLYISVSARILWIDYNSSSAMIGGVLLTLSSVIFLIITAEMDPGIIPRCNEFELALKSYAAPNASCIKGYNDTQYNKTMFPFRQTLTIDGHIVTHKYCITCGISRPPRSFHCQVCNNCIERFDHHCPWVGNCIGLRNYNYFLLFLISLNVLVFYVGFHCVLLLQNGWLLCVECSSALSFIFMCKQYPFTLGITLFIVLIFWFPVALLIFHFYIASTGQTTYEILRSRELNNIQNTNENEKENKNENDNDFMPELRPFKYASPYSLGFCGNLSNVFIKFPIKSNIHIRHKVPNIEKVNEAIINKRTVVYLNPDCIQQFEKEKLLYRNTDIEEEDAVNVSSKNKQEIQEDEDEDNESVFTIRRKQ